MSFVLATYGLSYLGYFNFIRWLVVFYFIIGLLTSIFIVMPQQFYGKDDLDVMSNESSLFSLDNCTAVVNENSTDVNFDQYVATKCCVSEYEKYLKENTQGDTVSIILDVFQGTVCST